MESSAHYFRVGTFVTLSVISLIVFLFWIGNTSLEDKRIPYDIYFKGSVTGLVIGSPVKYKGLNVGVVSDMNLPKENVEVIKVRIEVDPDVSIKEDAFAFLELQGITGGSYIQISGGSNDAINLKSTRHQVAVIQTRPSSTDTLFENIPKILTNFTDLSAKINRVLSEENIQHLDDSIAQFHELTKNMSSASSTFDEVLKENRPGISQFTNGTLGDLGSMIADFRQMAQKISAVADELQQNPVDFLFGDKDHEGVKLE